MRKFNKSIFALLFAVSLGAMASCANPGNGGEHKTTPIVNPFDGNTDIFIGDTVTISPREVVKDGVIYPCYDFYTITPDGNRISGQNIFVSSVGQYKVVYIAKLSDGSYVTNTDSFIAYQKAYNVEKPGSSVSYVNRIKGEDRAEYQTPGISTTLVEGDTWHYNQIIDISNSDLSKPIIKFYSSPMSEFLGNGGAPFIDATKQVLRITDYYDPTNYIDVQIGYFLANQGTGRMQTYAVAGGSHQTATGLMVGSTAWGTRRKVVLDGIDYTCCFGTDDFGATLNTVPGWNSYVHPSDDPKKPVYVPDITNSDRYGYSVYYVQATKRVYIKHRDLILITDLAEPLIHNDNIFKGFTTGEVTLSLRFESYQSQQATFEISEIYGTKGADLNKTKAVDTKAPEIHVDCAEDEFYIARNEEFTVPDAVAHDAYLKGDVECKVIYEKGTSFERNISLVDGKFKPTEVGKYSIVYTARDLFENVSTKEIVCNSINCTNNKLVSLTYTKINDTAAGTTISLAKPTIASPNGKGLYANLFITDPSGNETKFDVLNNAGLTYLLKRVGKYDVRYEYGDLAKSYVESYSFNSLASQKIYLESTTLPSYLIKGSKTSLDTNKAVLCDQSDVHYVDAKVEVSFDSGGYTTISDINNLEITGSNKAKIRYSYNNSIIYESEDISIIDVGFKGLLNLANYFASNDNSWTKSLNAQNIELKTSTDNELKFINPLTFSSFAIDFKLLGTEGYDSFSLVLTDYYDRANIIKFDFSYRSSALYLTFGDTTINLGNTNTVSLSYDYVSGALYYGPASYFHVDNKFSKDRCYLGFKFNNNSKENGISVSQIYNQAIKSSITKDTTAPVIAFNNIAGYYSLNQVLTIKETSVCDVLSPYLVKNHHLSVEYQKDASAMPEAVSSTDGVLLNGLEPANRDYDIKVTQYGLYTLTYYCEDQFNNQIYKQDVLHVVDDKGPVIVIDGADATTVDTCSLNAEVKVRNITVTDESEYTTVTYVVAPNGVISKVENNTFKATMTGTYKVTYYVTDSFGNVGSAFYRVNCK